MPPFPLPTAPLQLPIALLGLDAPHPWLFMAAGAAVGGVVALVGARRRGWTDGIRGWPIALGAALPAVFLAIHTARSSDESWGLPLLTIVAWMGVARVLEARGARLTAAGWMLPVLAAILVPTCIDAWQGPARHAWLGHIDPIEAFRSSYKISFLFRLWTDALQQSVQLVVAGVGLGVAAMGARHLKPRERTHMAIWSAQLVTVGGLFEAWRGIAHAWWAQDIQSAHAAWTLQWSLLWCLVGLAVVSRLRKASGWMSAGVTGTLLLCAGVVSGSLSVGLTDGAPEPSALLRRPECPAGVCGPPDSAVAMDEPDRVWAYPVFVPQLAELPVRFQDKVERPGDGTWTEKHQWR